MNRRAFLFAIAAAAGCFGAQPIGSAEPVVRQSAGAKPNAVLSGLANNTAKDLGPYTCTEVQGEPPGHCRLITDYSGMVYDKKRHRMVIFGGGHASTNYDSVNTFDLNGLRWIEEYRPTPCSSMTAANFDSAVGLWRSGPGTPYPRAAARHTTDQLIIWGDDLIVLAGVEGNGRCSTLPKYTGYDFVSPGRVAHYNFQTKSWSFHTAEGGQNWPGTAYDPVSNKVVLLGGVGLEIYDPVSKTKTRAVDLRAVYGVKDEHGNIIQNPLTYNNSLVYFPPNQKMYYFEAGSRSVFELSLDRADFRRSTIARVATTGTPPPTAHMGYAYDAVNKVIVGGPIQNSFYAYDPLTKSWKGQVAQGGTPGTIAFYAIDYDEVNNVFIVISDNATGRRTWAYRYAK